MILVIDNYDSFVYNLARHMELAGWTYAVARNDEINVADIEKFAPEAIILSPGPRAPADSGICIETIKRFGASIPMLGVCLGHQCIGAAYGARIVPAEKPVHGRASVIHHDGSDLFNGIPEHFKGGRYHSLVVELAEDAPLVVTARAGHGEIMGLRHASYPVYSVQFHPESVLTEHGMGIINNFSAIALAWNNRQKQIAA